MDIPAESLRAIHQRLLVDQEWTLWGENSFSWVGHRLRQDLTVSAPVDTDGGRHYRVWSTIPVVVDVQLDSAGVTARLALMNRLSVGEAFVWDASRRRVLSVTGATVHADRLDWRPLQIAEYSALALATSERVADMMAEDFRGRVAEWIHPSSGPRQDPDEMVSIDRSVFAPGGHAPNKFLGNAGFEEVHDTVRDTPYFSAGADSGGISIEVPFGEHDTSLIQLTASADHPVLGCGLLTRLRVRLPADVNNKAPDLAAFLGYLETSGTHLSCNFGAWCINSVDGVGSELAHAQFTPNVMWTKGRVVDAAWSTIRRAVWAAEVLLGEQGVLRRYAHEIWIERLLGDVPL